MVDGGSRGEGAGLVVEIAGLLFVRQNVPHLSEVLVGLFSLPVLVWATFADSLVGRLREDGSDSE